MSMGERTPVAVLDAPASGRLAVGEALTNILAADIGALSNVKLSANWMAACGEPGEDAALYATVRTVGEELCPALGIAIPVGKDSLSMKTVWGDGGATQVGSRARIADHFRIRARGRRAQDLDAAAAHRSRRVSVVARGSWQGREPAWRLGARAGVRRARQRACGPRIARAAHAARIRTRGAARAKPGAGISRPLRWRCVRDARGNGFRRSLRTRHQTTRAGGGATGAAGALFSKNSASCCR